MYTYYVLAGIAIINHNSRKSHYIYLGTDIRIALVELTGEGVITYKWLIVCHNCTHYNSSVIITDIGVFVQLLLCLLKLYFYN